MGPEFNILTLLGNYKGNYITVVVCACVGAVLQRGNLKKALKFFQASEEKSISININKVRRLCKKLLWRWQPLRYAWLSPGLPTSAQVCDLFVQAQMRAGRSIQNLAWDWEIYPVPSGSTSSVLPSPWQGLGCGVGGCFWLALMYFWGAQSCSSNVRSSGWPCHLAIPRPASPILT